MNYKKEVKLDVQESINNEYDIVWLGISAKQNKYGEIEEPLSSFTRSGKLIDLIEDELNVRSYRTNLVKFPPKDLNGKLRYPNKIEIEKSIYGLVKEIEIVRPRIIILLGEIVRKSISNHFSIEVPKCNDFNIQPVKYGEVVLFSTYHPSYVSVYKQKDKWRYKDAICKIICEIFED